MICVGNIPYIATEDCREYTTSFVRKALSKASEPERFVELDLALQVDDPALTMKKKPTSKTVDPEKSDHITLRCLITIPGDLASDAVAALNFKLFKRKDAPYKVATVWAIRATSIHVPILGISRDVFPKVVAPKACNQSDMVAENKRDRLLTLLENIRRVIGAEGAITLPHAESLSVEATHGKCLLVLSSYDLQKQVLASLSKLFWIPRPLSHTLFWYNYNSADTEQTDLLGWAFAIGNALIRPTGKDNMVALMFPDKKTMNTVYDKAVELKLDMVIGGVPTEEAQRYLFVILPRSSLGNVTRDAQLQNLVRGIQDYCNGTVFEKSAVRFLLSPDNCWLLTLDFGTRLACQGVYNLLKGQPNQAGIPLKSQDNIVLGYATFGINGRRETTVRTKNAFKTNQPTTARPSNPAIRAQLERLDALEKDLGLNAKDLFAKLKQQNFKHTANALIKLKSETSEGSSWVEVKTLHNSANLSGQTLKVFVKAVRQSHSGNWSLREGVNDAGRGSKTTSVRRQSKHVVFKPQYRPSSLRGSLAV